MSNSNLDILRQHRDEILKAEVGALIHNIGKFSEEFLRCETAAAHPLAASCGAS